MRIAEKEKEESRSQEKEMISFVVSPEFRLLNPEFLILGTLGILGISNFLWYSC
jgi:hypothetical protein